MTLSPICDDPMLLDDNIGNILLIPAAILMVPSVITTGLRIFARKNALGRDDWTILIGACLVVILNTLSIIGIQHGKGRHVCFLEDDQISIIGKYSWINQIVLFWALFFIKASVCLLVLRVKSTAVLRWVSGVTIGLMFISTVVACAALMAECKPVSAYWNRSSGQCRAPTFRIYSIWVQASVSVLTDLTCSLMPFPILWSLHLTPRKKIAVGLLMVMGAVAFIFAILRAASLSLTTSDTTYDYTLTGTWMTLETNIGLAASNIGLVRWWKYPAARAAAAAATGYDHSSSRDLVDHSNNHNLKNENNNNNTPFNDRASRLAIRVPTNDSDSDSDQSLCERRNPDDGIDVDEDMKKKKSVASACAASASISVDSGLDDSEGIPLEGRLRSVGSGR